MGQIGRKTLFEGFSSNKTVNENEDLHLYLWCKYIFVF